ncbi:MAG TPA: peptide chain release factor 1 [Bacilli bacterium]|nr:peptide chain release factor 1 [Bacilli bacterium]
MIDRLEGILKKYNELSEELTTQEVISDISKMTKLAKEQSSLSDIVEVYKDYKKILSDIEGSKELLDDQDLKEMAELELKELEEKSEMLEKKLELLLLPKDPDDDKNIIMEIRGAAGGDEANIFAGDLFHMYQKYCESQGWKLEVVHADYKEAGGFSQIEIMIKGDSIYSKLKYESGAHRVQRVPDTESQGRVHTSTATVLVMPEREEVDIEISPGDLRIDVFHSGGAGGQSVNTTDSAVRITHLPTNTVVSCQNERSQLQNKEKAMQILRAKLYDKKMEEENSKFETERKSKIGTGDRSEKIRTYNYPQNRVTDHRIGFTINKLDRVMEGELEEIIEALINEDQKRKLAAQ